MSKRISAFRRPFVFILFLTIFSFRFLEFDNLPPDHLTNHISSNQKVSLSGIIDSPPEKFSRKTRLNIESEYLTTKGKEIKVSSRVRITVYEKNLPFKYGDRIKINAVRLRLPRNFKNEGTFDYESYMKNKGIYVTGSVSKGKKIELIDRNNGFWVLEKIYYFKDSMLSSFESFLPFRNSTIIRAMVLGDKGALSKRDRETFMRSGTAHLMAVSGLHVGFLAFVSYWIIRKITALVMVRFFIEKALSGWMIPVSAILSIIPVLFYMVLVGWKASSMRAGIMVVVYLIAVALSREKEIYRSIFIAAFIILFWKPLSYQDIGFQLSFIAVLTIIFCYQELIRKKDTLNDLPVKKNKIIQTLRGNLEINLFAVLGTAPLILYYFNRITPYAFFANILAVPLAALIIPGAIICMIIFPVFEWAGILGFKVISFLTSTFMFIINFFSELPMASLRFATPSFWAVSSFYLLAFLLIKLKEKRQRKWILISAGGILLISLSINYFPFWRDSYLKVTFLDVGQGDSTLIELPDGKNMLIDGGGLFGDFDIGESVVAPYLWDQGIEKLDFIIPTHSDNDHIEGLFYVLKEMKTGVLWTNSLIPFKTNLRRLENLATKKKIPIKNQSISLNSLDIKIEKIHPTKGFALNYFDRNENNFSTVLKISYGEISFLFASDIEKEAEEYLVRLHGNKLRSTILKVPHHGSKTSSTTSFIKAVKPEVAIISAGYMNRFQHPAKKVVDRYKKNSIKFHRTDLEGAITITTDGLKYKIKTYIDDKK